MRECNDPTTNADEISVAVDRPTADRQDPLYLFTVQELCDLLGVKRSWVYDAVERAELPVRRLNRQLRVMRADIERYLGGDRAA